MSTVEPLSIPPTGSVTASLLQQALSLHQRGQLSQAEGLYRQILQLEPEHAEALHLLGIVALQSGQALRAEGLIRHSLERNPAQPVAHLNLAAALRELQRPVEALGQLQQALSLAPGYAEAHNNLGDLLLQLERPAEALQSLEQAVRLQPEFALAWNNRGNALRSLQRFEDALASYQQALRLDPGFVRAHNNRGNTLRDLRRLEPALACYEQALALQPDYSPALLNSGNALLELERYQEALARYERLLQMTPADADALTHRAIALLRLKRFDEALVSLDAALALQPDLALALNNRGNALSALKRPHEALASYERALRLTPDDAETWGNHGNALAALHQYPQALQSHERALQLDGSVAGRLHNRAQILMALGRTTAAVDDYERALALEPELTPALFGMGTALLKLRRTDEAIGCLSRLIGLDPDYPYADGVRLNAKLIGCDWQGFADERQRLLEKVARGVTVDLPFSIFSLTSDAAVQLHCARLHVAEKYPTTATQYPRPAPYRHERIRLAYVSADLRTHVLSMLLAGVFEQHDRQRFEVIAIALNPAEDSLFGRRIRAAFDRYVDASAMADHEVLALMHGLEIDIAVDLTGFTEGNRTDIFARRAAPIQVNYLGYPGTMGAQFMDYIIADPHVLPEEQQIYFSEKIAYLPCFQANDSLRTSLGQRPRRSELGLPDDGFVWCCFNATHKLNPGMFDVWMPLLQAVEGSVLWLVAEGEPVRVRLRQEAVRRGVDAERLVFADRTGFEAYLSRLSAADLFLDTQPFTGGATASDALWAGLPVLTCTGKAFASRMASSLLRAIRLPELVAGDLAEYAQRALQLARDPAQLQAVRTRLAAEQGRSRLFDTSAFCLHLESAYTSMWQRYERGEPPATFKVAG